MIKKNKGITLIALVITIIVLLILAMVSVNAIVGENGIISRAIESRIVSIIADVIFRLEDSIVDINTESILTGKKLIASEVMKELENRELLLKEEETEGLNFFTSSMQQEIKEDRIKPLYLGFNGDIWYDNYKRGKVNLSSQSNTLYSRDTKTKITVVDGTVEELKDNYKYYLHSLENRGDFVCWINSYGEVVSTFKDTIIYINIPREEEFTAVYDKDMKIKMAKLNPTIDNYVKFLNDEEKSTVNNCIMGLNSSLVNKNGDIYFEAQTTHSNYTNCYKEDLLGEENNYILNPGCHVSSINLYISDKYENLVLKENGKIKKPSVYDHEVWDIDEDDYIDERFGYDDYDYSDDEGKPIDYNLTEIRYYWGSRYSGPKWAEDYEESGVLTKDQYINYIKSCLESERDYIDSYNTEWEKFSRFQDVGFLNSEDYETIIDYWLNAPEGDDGSGLPEELQEDYRNFVKYELFNDYYNMEYEEDEDEDEEEYIIPDELLDEYNEFVKFQEYEENYPYFDDEFYGFMDDSELYMCEGFYFEDYGYEIEPSFLTLINYIDGNEDVTDVFTEEFKSIDNYENYKKPTETYIPIIEDKNNLKYTSEIDYISLDITNQLKKFKEKTKVNRIYYRVGIDYGEFIVDSNGISNGEILTDYNWDDIDSRSVADYYSPVIKYIDL